jgi:hypothetical protein
MIGVGAGTLIAAVALLRASVQSPNGGAGVTDRDQLPLSASLESLAK